jgi:hypothetical protein
MLFGPMAFGLGLESPVVAIALRRYSTPVTQTLAFSIHYVIMNMAAALSQVLVDAVRLGAIWLTGEPDTTHIVIMGRPLWSFFIGLQCVLQLTGAVVVYFYVTDIRVIPPPPPPGEEKGEGATYSRPLEEDEKWVTEPVPIPPSNGLTPASQVFQNVCSVFRDSLFWKLVLLSFSLIGAKSVFVFLYTLYPVYMKRAPFVGVADPAAVPFMTFLVIDPIVVITLTWPIAALVTKYKWERFWVIFAGTLLASVAPFLMMPYYYPFVIGFIILDSFAESIWSPLFQKYANEFAPPGKEGLFFGMVGMVLFMGKLLGGASGELLAHYCPAQGQCAQGYMIWLIVGCVTLSTPIFMLASCKWTWIRNNTSGDYAGKKDVEMEELDFH